MQKNDIPKFNHLKIHSQYSICEGAIKIDKLKDICKERKIKAIGISDTSNLCGALEFAENISKVGTQPIIGTQINFKFDETVGLIPLIALISCFLLSSRRDKKNLFLNKYFIFIFGFIILVCSEIFVRYSGNSFNHTLAYYLLPVVLLPLAYLFLITKFKYENLN